MREHLLKNHIKIAHTEKSDSPIRFSCPECSNSYSREHLLKNHLKSVHDAKIDITVPATGPEETVTIPEK